MQIRWLTKAAMDLERISDYLRQEAPESADRILEELFDGCNSLVDMPRRGRAYGTNGLRQLIFRESRYLVTYRVSDEAVTIMRIRHTSQRPLIH